MKREEYGLGRKPPPDWQHVAQWPHSRAALPPTPATVETTLALTDTLRAYYDQRDTPQCVGYSAAIALSIYSKNAEEFSGKDIWHQAQVLEGAVDPNNGAYVRDGFETVSKRGPLEVKPKKAIDLADGYSAYYWCTTSAEVREALAAGRIVIFGLDWYSNFDHPATKGGEKWIGLASNLGGVRGGHAICGTRWSDRRQAVMLTNSWGRSFPRVWLPASVLDKYLPLGWECGYGMFRGG